MEISNGLCSQSKRCVQYRLRNRGQNFLRKLYTRTMGRNSATKSFVNSSRLKELSTKRLQKKEQNARLERENGTTVKSVRSMLYMKDLPKYLWAEAFNTAIYLLNRERLRVTPNTTPFEICYGKKPTLSHVSVHHFIL